jgi:Ca2+ transporting ATPase
MAKKKKGTADPNAVSAEEAGREFGISLKELETLMQTRGHEGVKEVNETYGGLSGLGQKLKTNLISGKIKSYSYFVLFSFFSKGLSGDESDLSVRVAAFGRNEIPPQPPKTFFRLMFEAIQDITLVILIICAVISFALSFYHPGGDTFEADLKPSKIQMIFFFSLKFLLFQKKQMLNGLKVQLLL